MLGAAFVTYQGTLYPAHPILINGAFFGDQWGREVLNQTNDWSLYTEAENGAGGSGAIRTGKDGYNLNTDTTIGNDYDLRTNIGWARVSPFGVPVMPSFSQLTFRMQFATSDTADVEGFVGMHDMTSTQLSALPTTVRHMGVYYDISAGANYMLSVANGTTQVTQDTGIAVAAGARTLEIIWTGANAATLSIGAGTGLTASGTDLDSAGVYYAHHWFVQTEAAAAKQLVVYPWAVKFGTGP